MLINAPTMQKMGGWRVLHEAVKFLAIVYHQKEFVAGCYLSLLGFAIY